MTCAANFTFWAFWAILAYDRWSAAFALLLAYHIVYGLPPYHTHVHGSGNESSGSSQPGQAVCRLGSSRAITGVLARGTLTSARGSSDWQSALRLQPGRSGGPVLNTADQIVGINKSIRVTETGANEGISFATKAAIAQAFASQHQQAGQASSQAAHSDGALGVSQR